MKYIERIPLGDIERVQIYINTAKKTLAQVKAATGADYVMNGGVFNSAFRPVLHLRADGVTYASDPYNYFGYGWNESDLRVVESRHAESVRNYICCIELIRDGTPISKPVYNADMGGVRGRTAMALTAAGELILYCSRDGSADAKTPEALRDELLGSGAVSAVMLDGGGSSQCDFEGQKITSTREVENLICVYRKKGEREPQESGGNEPLPSRTSRDTFTKGEGEARGKSEKGSDEMKHIVYLDAGHGGTDTSNGSPDGTYKEHLFTLDMAERVKALLEAQGVTVGMTRTADGESVELRQRAVRANNAGAELFVSLHSNATSGGWGTAHGLCVYTYAEGGKRDELANAILAEMRAAGVGILGAGLFHSGFAVLKYTNMPAVLIEYGFHTNVNDVAQLKADGYREKLATATAKGICKQLGVTWTEGGAEAGGEPEGYSAWRKCMEWYRLHG